MELTTTSYAILCLLGIRSWSTYELAQQMQRSTDWLWPRAESVIYEEPKKLVALGLARAKTEFTGKRKRTVYTITAKGRRALASWFDEPGANPVLQFEAMLQVAFADLGTKRQLLATLRAIRRRADAQMDEVEARLNEYASSGGPFPDRRAIIALTGRYLAEHHALTARWAAWAESIVKRWPSLAEATTPVEAFTPPRRR